MIIRRFFFMFLTEDLSVPVSCLYLFVLSFSPSAETQNRVEVQGSYHWWFCPDVQWIGYQLAAESLILARSVNFCAIFCNYCLSNYYKTAREIETRCFETDNKINGVEITDILSMNDFFCRKIWWCKLNWWKYPRWQ